MSLRNDFALNYGQLCWKIKSFYWFDVHESVERAQNIDWLSNIVFIDCLHWFCSHLAAKRLDRRLICMQVQSPDLIPTLTGGDQRPSSSTKVQKTFPNWPFAFKQFVIWAATRLKTSAFHLVGWKTEHNLNEHFAPSNPLMNDFASIVNFTWNCEWRLKIWSEFFWLALLVLFMKKLWPWHALAKIHSCCEGISCGRATPVVQFICFIRETFHPKLRQPFANKCNGVSIIFDENESDWFVANPKNNVTSPTASSDF